MATHFNFEKYNELEFFHLKYGRGAVIIAVQEHDIRKVGRLLEAPIMFHRKGNRNHGDNMYFDKVLSINELDGFVHVELEMINHHPSQSSRQTKAKFLRIIPNNQVTFEVVLEASIP